MSNLRALSLRSTAADPCQMARGDGSFDISCLSTAFVFFSPARRRVPGRAMLRTRSTVVCGILPPGPWPGIVPELKMDCISSSSRAPLPVRAKTFRSQSDHAEDVPKADVTRCAHAARLHGRDSVIAGLSFLFLSSRDSDLFFFHTW